MKIDELISRNAVMSRKVEVPLFGKMVDMVAVSEIERVPVEYVKVVRCRDCKHYEADGLFGGAWCDGKRVTADWFCADGERRKHDDG